MSELKEAVMRLEARQSGCIRDVSNRNLKSQSAPLALTCGMHDFRTRQLPGAGRRRRPLISDVAVPVTATVMQVCF